MNEEKNKNEKECPLCQVSEETISQLKEKGREKYLLKKETKESERALKVRQKKIKAIISFLIFILIGLGLVIGLKSVWSRLPASQNLAKTSIKIFYSPTCSCCHQYISYLKQNGFEVLEEKEMAKRMEILEKYQIPDEMTACHTLLVGDYFVEGHMPVEVIKKLLEEKPKIDGIALPGMPQGSPGMPGFKVGKWTIYAFSNGQPSEFTKF